MAYGHMQVNIYVLFTYAVQPKGLKNRKLIAIMTWVKCVFQGKSLKLINAALLDKLHDVMSGPAILACKKPYQCRSRVPHSRRNNIYAPQYFTTS